MMKKPLMLASALLLTASSLGVTLVMAQESDTADDRRAQFEERRQERMAEMQARRDERWQAFAEENPEIAAEMQALQEERQAEREAQRAEFAEKYPNLAAAMEEGRRFPGFNQASGERFRGEGPRGERMRNNRGAERHAHGPRGPFRGGPRR
jgi:hypothetical protein